jgi:acetylornithine/N-succinyldiaminopimelate aminotransferase
VTAALMPTYARRDVAFERGEGAYLFTKDGKRYLDFAGGMAVMALGHCHPYLVKALADQASKIWHCSNLYHIPEQERLAQRLVENSFADAVFFGNSGAEAVECALKMARRYHALQGRSERYSVVACKNAFHGRTLATIAAGGQEKHLEGFAPAMEGFDHVAFANMNEMRAAINETTAAILVEPVQGEGGVHPASAEYLQGLRAAADEYGVLLIFDEVQCGMGRTGKLFAHEWAGVTPDIMTLAKGLGGGFPVGACLAKERVAAVMTPGTHGSTFGGNPLAMAVANAVLDVVLAEGFLGAVEKTAKTLEAGLQTLAARYSGVFEGVRSRGLMVGLQCVVNNADFAASLMKNGLLSAVASGNVVRLLPPLIIGEAEVAEALKIIEAACLDVAEKESSS